MSAAPSNRDIIVIGGSSGAIDALQRLMADLPADLPASVFIVVHVGRSQSHLADILDRAGPLPVRQAKSGAPIERGHVYIAAPDHHLLLHEDHILLRRGPHENMSRPAIDPLFRSAACNFDGRVIGVVLSGSLDDGTAGSQAVKRCGGLVVIQDPADAVFPGMPASVQRHVAIDACVPIVAMGALLARLAREPAPRRIDIPEDICVEAAIAAQEVSHDGPIGTLSPFSCPECGGSLWEVAEGGTLRYRCHVGHAFAAQSMLAAESERIDDLLGRLLRSHRERAGVVRRMAEQARSRQLTASIAELEARAEDYEESATLIEELIRRQNGRPGT